MNVSGHLWWRRTLVFIAVVSLARLALIPLLPATPQDAYYWQYAKHPALGYFDHPPMHAFTAMLTTGVFGDNVFGIRLGPWLYGVGLLFLLYEFGRRLADERAGFWCAVIAGSTPLFTIGSAVLTPDPPLLFFWMLSIYCGYRSLTGGTPIWWLGAGFAGGLAMLSKYTAVFIAVGFILIFIFSKKARKWLLTPYPYLAIVLAFMAFLPQFIWNAQNDWASFAYQSTRRAGEISRWRIDLFAGMLGSQIAVVSPLIFFGMIWAIFRAGLNGFFEKRKSDSQKPLCSKFDNLFLFAFSAPLIVFFSLVALRYWVKLNWFAPSYVAGALALVVFFYDEKRKIKFLRWSAIVAGIETFLLCFIALSPFVPLTGEAGYWKGWREISERVETELREMPKGTFIAGWGYKVPSELRFHLPGNPETHSNEILGFHGLNYSYWTNIESLIGRDCIFVADSREPFRDPEILNDYFERVEELDPLIPISAGKKITTFRLWRCYGYKHP